MFVPAAGIYYGIEALEGNGLEIGLPTVVLAVFSIVLAFALRRLRRSWRTSMADLINDWLALLERRERLIWHLALHPQPIHAQDVRAARRFGRAPPNRRRLH